MYYSRYSEVFIPIRNEFKKNIQSVYTGPTDQKILKIGWRQYIYDLAIQPEFQRKGLGKKLITALKKNCSENGIREIFVATHEKDTPTLDFYQSTGEKAEKVIHFNYTT